MPILKSNFSPKFPFTNKHLSTVFRTIFSSPKVNYDRQRIETKDQDFLDIDISSIQSENLALMIHGLEGSSNSKYIRSTVNFLNRNNIDVIILNLRGCSGYINKTFKAYHSGETGDLAFILQYIEQQYTYKNISLVGFSLGGNVVLKYAGEQKKNLLNKVSSVVAICPPCDLKGSSEILAKKSNSIYMKRFLNTLISKSVIKSQMHPEQSLDIHQLKQSKNFKDFDGVFTAPSFGFKDAEDYWKKASSKQFLKDVQVPTYVLSAENDPFLSKSCIPYTIAKEHAFLHLEVPKFGGHIGFIDSWLPSKNTWCEERIEKFITENLNKQ